MAVPLQTSSIDTSLESQPCSLQFPLKGAIVLDALGLYQKTYKRVGPRNLAAAYKNLCGRIDS